MVPLGSQIQRFTIKIKLVYSFMLITILYLIKQ